MNIKKNYLMSLRDPFLPLYRYFFIYIINMYQLLLNFFPIILFLMVKILYGFYKIYNIFISIFLIHLIFLCVFIQEITKILIKES